MKKSSARFISVFLSLNLVLQDIYPLLVFGLGQMTAPPPASAGQTCDGHTGRHRNAGNGCFYTCSTETGQWGPPEACDGQGNGQFQGEAAKTEEERRQQDEAVRDRERQAKEQIEKQGGAESEETRRVAEETARQRAGEEQKQREMAAAQLAAARAEADRIAAENAAKAEALRVEAERRAQEAAQKIEAITPQLPAATPAPTAGPTAVPAAAAVSAPTPTATPTPAPNIPGLAGDKAWGDCKLAGGADADCTKKAQDAYIAQEHQEIVQYIEAGSTPEKYYQDNKDRKQKDAINGQIAGEVVRQLNAAGRSTGDLSQAEYDRIQQIIHLELPQAEALNTVLGQNPAEISRLVSAGLRGGTASQQTVADPKTSAAVKDILQGTGIAATATPTVSSAETCLQAGGCIGGYDGKTCLPGGTVSRDGILVCQNGSWLAAVSLTPTLAPAATATPALTTAPAVTLTLAPTPKPSPMPLPTAVPTPKPSVTPSCSTSQLLSGTCKLTPTPQLTVPAAGGYTGFSCQGKLSGQEFSGPGGYRFVCDTYTSVPRAVSSPAAFLPTSAVKPEICRPGTRRLPDGSCANPTPLPTLAVQPTVAEKLLFDTVTYECRGDVSVTTVRSLLGVIGGSPPVVTEEKCNWGCSSGKCQGPTAEKWEQRLRETYNVAVERELGKPLADATEQEISQAYDEVSDINYWKMTGSSPSVLEGDPMSTTIKDLYNDPPLTEAQLEAVVEWKTDELTRTAVQEGAFVGERKCGINDRKCFRDLAEKEVERILESYGGLSYTNSDALTGDSPQFDAIANLSAQEAKAQVDAQQTLYGKIVADAMFEDLNPAYRAAFHRDDLISVNWNRDQWASILTGQGILGSVIGSMGQEKLGFVQQPVVMENAVKFCGLRGGETDFTEEQKACVIASSIAVKANLDTYDTQRLQNVLLTAVEATAGVASGGTLVATLPVAMALAPAQTLVNTQGIAAMAEVRGAFADAAEEELADLKSRKATEVQIGDEQLAQAEAVAAQAREQANQAKEQYAAEYWAQLPINMAMAGGGELAGEGLSVVGRNFFRYWRGVGKAGAEGVAEEMAEAAAETAARAGVDLPSQPKPGALAQQVDDLAVGVEVVAGGKPPDVTVPAVVAGVDTVPVGGAVAEAAAAIAEVKGPGLGARIGAAWDGSAWNKGNWRPRTITVEPGGRVGGMFEMGIVDVSSGKPVARIFPDAGKPVLVGGEEIVVPPTGGINVYPGETVSVGGRTVTVTDISAGSVALTAEPYRPFGGLFGGGRQAAKEGGEAVAEVAAPVAKEVPPVAAVVPEALPAPERKTGYEVIQYFFGGLKGGITEGRFGKIREYDLRIRAVFEGRPLKPGDTLEALTKDFRQVSGQDWSENINIDDLIERQRSGAAPEVAEQVGKEAPLAAVKPPAEIVPEVKPPHIPFSDRVSNLLDSVLPERTIARNADDLIAGSGGKQGLYQEIVRAVGGAESQPTIAAARRNSQQAVLDFVDVRSKALGLNLSPEQVSSVSRKLYDDLNLEQGLDYLTKTQPAVVNGGAKVIDYKGQDAAALVKGSDLPDIGKVDTMGIIADGHGNQREGKIAAQIAKEQFAGFYLHHVSKGKNPKEAIRAAIGDLDNVITNEIGPAGHGGTTFTVAVQKGNELYVGNVGDSRLYLIDGQTGNIRQVTVDHNWPGGERRYGILVSRSLGDLDIKTISKGKFSSRPDIFGPFPVKEGDMVVMGSDSLEKLGRILGGENNLERTLVEIATSLNPNQAASSLAELALKNRVKDDIGVVVMRVDSVGGKAIGLEPPVFKPEDRGILRRLFGIGEPAGIVAPGAKAINDVVGGIGARFGRGDSLDDLVGPAGAIHSPEFLVDVRPDPILRDAVRARPETNYSNQLKGYLDENPIRFGLDADGNRIPLSPEDVAKLKEASQRGLRPDEISAKVVTPEGEQPTVHLDDLFECNPISLGFRLIPKVYAASRGPCPLGVFQNPTVVRPDGSSEDLITTEDIGGGGYGKVQRIKPGEVAKTAFDKERASYLSAERQWLDTANRRGFGDFLPQVTGEIRDGSGEFIGFTMTEVERAVTLTQWPHSIPDDISSGFFQRLADLDDAGLLHRDIFPKNVMVVLEPDPSLAKGFRPNKLVLIDPIKPVGGEIIHAFLDPDGSLAQSYLRGGHYQTRTLADGALAVIVPESNVGAAKALVNQHNFTLSSPEFFQLRNPLSDGELKGVAENTILPKYDRVPVDELPTDNPASTTRDEIRSIKNTSGTDLERTTDDVADTLDLPCNPITFRFGVPQAYAGPRDPCPITLVGPNNPAAKAAKTIRDLFGGEELPAKIISSADEDIAEAIQPFFKTLLSDSPRSTAGRIRGGTTTATVIGDPANPDFLILESKTTGNITIKSRPGQTPNESTLHQAINNLKTNRPDGFAVTKQTQNQFTDELAAAGFVPDPSGRLTWVPESSRPTNVLTTPKGYSATRIDITSNGEARFSVTNKSGDQIAEIWFDGQGNRVTRVVNPGTAQETADAIGIVAAHTDRTIWVYPSTLRQVPETTDFLLKNGFARTAGGRLFFSPELVKPKGSIAGWLTTGIGITAAVLAGRNYYLSQTEPEETKTYPKYTWLEEEKGTTQASTVEPQEITTICNPLTGLWELHSGGLIQETENICYLVDPVMQPGQPTDDPELASTSPSQEESGSFTEKETPNEIGIDISFGITGPGTLNLEQNFTPPNLETIVGYEGVVSRNQEIQIQQAALPYLLNFLKEAESRGYSLIIMDGYRSYEQQTTNYNDNPSQNAPSGQSQHQSGLAFDIYWVPNNDWYDPNNWKPIPRELIEIAPDYGLVHTLAWDPAHFVVLDAIFPGIIQQMVAVGIDPIPGDPSYMKANEFVNNVLMFKYTGIAVESIGSGKESTESEEISAAGGGSAAGFAGAVDHRGQGHQYQSQGKDRHNQIEISQLVHDVLPANQSAISQNVKVPVTPYIKPVVQLLSNKAGTKIEPIEISPAPTAISTKALNWSGDNLGLRGVNTNSNSAIEENGNTIDNWLSMLAPQVYAAEKNSARIVPLSVYKMLAGQIMVKKVMESLPAEDRTTEKLAEAVLAAGTLVNALPERGTLTAAEGIITGITGTRGIAAGAAAKGIYRVQVDPIAGVDFILPQQVKVGSEGNGAVMIGVVEGKGRIKIVGEISIWEKLSGKIIPGARAQTQNSAIASTVPLTVQLFHDKNKNGRQESGELSVQWAGMKVVLAAATETISYQLNQGWNFISLPFIPESVKTAAELIQDTALDGGYVTTVAAWEGDKWAEFSQRGAEKFGQDFELQPGRAYFLNSHSESTWTLAGTPLPEEKRVLQLRKGWNGVGIPKQGTTAVQVMDEIQITDNRKQTTVSGELADQVGRWDYGLWDVVVKRRYSPEHHEIYGRDFPIRPEEGYFIHANEDVRFQ